MDAKKIKEELNDFIRKLEKPTKKEILERDGKKCVLCGDIEDLQIHHIKTRILGGNNGANNLVTLCQYCHWYLHANPKFICSNKDLIKKSTMRVNGKTYSYRGKKWGRKPLQDVEEKILELHKQGKSIREISKEVYYWDKSRNKKFISKLAVHKILGNLNKENTSQDGISRKH